MKALNELAREVNRVPATLIRAAAILGVPIKKARSSKSGQTVNAVEEADAQKLMRYLEGEV